MRRIGEIGTVLLLAAAASASANTECTTANGDVKYRETAYAGGPPPPPDFELGRAEWFLSGVVADRVVRCTSGEGLPPERLRICPVDPEIHDADLRIGFVPGTDVTLYESPADEPWHQVRKYIVEIEAERPSGKALPNGLATFRDFAICELNLIFAP